jgi:Phage integrase, N-terminal SAM-like domain
MGDGQPPFWTRSGTGSGGSTTASGPTRHTWTGSAASYCITTRGTPGDMGAAEAEGFLTHLAVAKGVSASRQNQAKSAVLFLYKEVLGRASSLARRHQGGEAAGAPAGRADARGGRIDLAHLSGTVGLTIRLLYGTGMGIMGCVRLRVKDIEFGGLKGHAGTLLLTSPHTCCRRISCSAGTIMV